MEVPQRRELTPLEPVHLRQSVRFVMPGPDSEIHDVSELVEAWSEFALGAEIRLELDGDVTTYRVRRTERSEEVFDDGTIECKWLVFIEVAVVSERLYPVLPALLPKVEVPRRRRSARG